MKLQIDKRQAATTAEHLATLTLARTASLATLTYQDLAPAVQLHIAEVAEADAVRLVAALRAFLAAAREAIEAEGAPV